MQIAIKEDIQKINDVLWCVPLPLKDRETLELIRDILKIRLISEGVVWS